MNDLKQRLSADHQQLEQQLRTLAHAVDANDPACDVRECYNLFEAALLDHLETEERSIFPVVIAQHRQEVEALRAEHQVIRRSLGELGLQVELHTLRKEAMDQLTLFLQQHAARENGALYEWLGSDARARQGLLAMFERRRHMSDRGSPAKPASPG